MKELQQNVAIRCTAAMSFILRLASTENQLEAAFLRFDLASTSS